MTLGRAKAILSGFWFIFGGIVYMIVAYLTLIGRFDLGPGDWDAGLAWVSPLILPVLGFILPTMTLTSVPRDLIKIKHVHVFGIVLTLSLFYIGLLFLLLWRLPLEIDKIETYVGNVMRSSLWYMGAFQAVIMGLLGKFYLEEVNPGRPDNPGNAPSTGAGRAGEL